MKNNLIKSISLIILAFCFIPVFSQDALIVFFNDGNFRKFNLNDIVEISTSKYDDKGVAHSTYQFQYIVTKNDKYVYDLNNINLIAFSKYEEEKAEQNFVKAMPEVANALSECENIHDAENQLNQIKGKDGVEDAWSDGHKLYVKIDEGETFSFHFNHGAQVEVGETRSVDYAGLARSFISSAKRTGVTNNEGIKVVVANQQYHDEERSETRRDFIEPLVDAFINCGIHADYVTNPTVDFFYDNSNDPNHLHIYDYDIILLITHGAYLQLRYLASNSSFLRGFYEEVAQYDQKCHAILADADWELANIPMKGKYNNKWKECYSNFKTWKNNSKYQNISDLDICFEFMEETRGGEKRWIGYPVLTEHFFRNTATGRFHDNSILFNVACQSLLGDNGPDYPSYSFANTLFAKNLSLYAGYTETNILGGGFMPQFLNNMLKGGKSIGAVYSDPDLPEYFKVETRENIINSTKLSDKRKQEYLDDDPQGARILFLPESDAQRRFLFNVYTSEVDQNAATNEYKSDNTVTVSCTLTVSKPSNVSAGFEYGTDKNNLSQVKQCESYRNIENKGKGNYCFNAKLTDLERGNTYYYRAYTYDGLNFNYGNLCSFTVYPDLQVPAQKLELEEGEKVSFTIAAGSGEYTAKSDKENYAKASVKGNEVFIEAISEGNAIVTITDTKTSQTADVAVKVIKKVADLQLSATKLSLVEGGSGTVEITSGSGKYVYGHENNGIVSVDINGSIITINALKAGEIVVIITDTESGQQASIVITVAAPVCPARITNVEFLGPEYHHSSERQNQMPYTVTAALDDMTDIEEWGICYYGTTIGEFPFESISNEQSKILRLNVATSNLGNTTKVKVDFDAYVVEFNDEVGVYVKKRDKATGELMTIYGEKYPFTFRYDTKPSLVYSDPTIRETKVIGTKNGHKQYQTIVDYNYSAKGTFWMEYGSYVVVGNNWNNSGSSKLYFEKDEDGQLNSTEKYWDNSKLGHSAYEVIYLRNSKKTYSNCLNFSGSNGYINNVWVSSSPAYSARQKESNSGDSEYMNYMIINTPTEDINAKQKKVINQIPYGGGCLEEIAY